MGNHQVSVNQLIKETVPALGWILAVSTDPNCTLYYRRNPVAFSSLRGSSASVFEGQARLFFSDGRVIELPVAIRVPEPPSSFGDHEDQLEFSRSSILRDVALTSNWKHRNIARPLGYYFSNQVWEQCIIYPFYTDGTLGRFFKGHQVLDDFKVDTIVQTLEAFSTLHSTGYIYGDTHSDNVMMHEGRPVLIDFERTKHIEETSFDETGGTRRGANDFWISPERRRSPGSLVSQPDDVYSVGILILSVFTGNGPYADMSPTRTIQALLKDEPPASRSDLGQLFQSESWWDLITSCWKPQSSRPTMQQVANRVKQIAHNHYHQTN